MILIYFFINSFFIFFSRSISAIIQAQIFEDDTNPEDMKNKYSEFNLRIGLPAELGGNMEVVPECVLDHETLDDSELREKIVEGCVPTVDTIFRYVPCLSRVFC